MSSLMRTYPIFNQRHNIKLTLLDNQTYGPSPC